MEVIHTYVSRTGPPFQSGDISLSDLGTINMSFESWLEKETWAQRVVCFYEVSPIPRRGIVSQMLPTCLLIDHYLTPNTRWSNKNTRSYQSVTAYPSTLII